jgi:hypothetical protein
MLLISVTRGAKHVLHEDIRRGREVQHMADKQSHQLAGIG